jgi:outer membrane lipoprotein-sorting protein
MKRFIIVQAVLFLCLGPCVSAHDLQVLSGDAAGKAVSAINAANAGTASMQADFMQVKEMSIVKERMVSTGRMYYRDGSLRWEYLTPSRTVFITDREQLKSDRMFRNIAGMMMSAFMGIRLDDPAFEVTLYTPGTGYVADLVPRTRDLKRMFSRIRLHFGPDNRVGRVELEESQGRTVITFSKVKFNQSLDPGLFLSK